MSGFKGFAALSSAIDNDKGIVAPVGEISQLSFTQVREHTIHTLANFPGNVLFGFYYTNDAGVIGQTPDAVAAAILAVSDWIYAQMRNGQFNSDAADFRQKFTAQFNSQYELGQSGAMVASGADYAPEYITISPNNAAVFTEWRIWFADEAFLHQFDITEHNSVPPVAAIDRFFESYQSVLNMVNAIDPIETRERINAARGINPESKTRIDKFDWVDPQNPNRTIPTYWNDVIYGLAGDNYDSVKNAHREYILSHSAFGADRWSEIFPSLFSSAEFILVPFYHKYSMPNMAREQGIYAGIIDPIDGAYMAMQGCKGPGYTQAHVTSRMSYVPSHYKSVMSAAVGGPDNGTTLRKFQDQFPDLMNVPTDHVDFGKMSEQTRLMVLKLQDMFEQAETLTATNSVPVGYNRIIRDGVIYLATTFQNFLILVVTKGSIEKIDEERP